MTFEMSCYIKKVTVYFAMGKMLEGRVIIMMNFAKAIKKMRLELAMAQSDLAMVLGVNVATVSRWENGHNIPNSSIAEKILEIAEMNHLSEECRIQLKITLQNGLYGDGTNNLSHVPTDVVNKIVNDY